MLSDADIEALKAGQPMSWESGDGAPAPVAASPAPAAEVPTSQPAATAAPANAGLSEDVAKWVAEGRKWSKSTIAAEQARRGRKGLPALNDVEIAALLGEEVASADELAACDANAADWDDASLKFWYAQERTRAMA